MRRTLSRLPVLVTLVLAGAIAGTGPATAHPAVECAGLDQLKIPASVMSLPTTGGRVTSTSVKTSVLSGVTITYCQVDASISPVDPAAPEIKMRLALPHGWNRQAMMFGGGGYNGTIPDLTANVPFGPADQPVPLARRYAMFAGDSGHQQNPAVPPSLDGSFGANDEALHNFAAGDALKKTRDASLFLIRHAYRQSQPRSTSRAARRVAAKPSSSLNGGRKPSTA